MLADRNICSISMKMSLPCKHSTQGHFNQQLIALIIYVNEANSLQSCLCQLIAKKGQWYYVLKYALKFIK